MKLKKNLKYGQVRMHLGGLLKNIKGVVVNILEQNLHHPVFQDGIKKNGLMYVNYQKKYLVGDLNFQQPGKKIIHIVVLQ